MGKFEQDYLQFRGGRIYTALPEPIGAVDDGPEEVTGSSGCFGLFPYFSPYSTQLYAAAPITVMKVPCETTASECLEAQTEHARRSTNHSVQKRDRILEDDNGQNDGNNVLDVSRDGDGKGRRLLGRDEVGEIEQECQESVQRQHV
jgi:hypothetical protein